MAAGEPNRGPVLGETVFQSLRTGGCGSCWAVAATGALEMHAAKHNMKATMEAIVGMIALITGILGPGLQQMIIGMSM